MSGFVPHQLVGAFVKPKDLTVSFNKGEGLGNGGWHHNSASLLNRRHLRRRVCSLQRQQGGENGILRSGLHCRGILTGCRVGRSLDMFMLAIATSADEAVAEPPTGGFVAVDAVGVAV